MLDQPDPIDFARQEAAWLDAAEELADFAELKIEPDPIRLRALVENLVHDLGELKRQRTELQGRRRGDVAQLTARDLEEVAADWLERGFTRAACGVATCWLLPGSTRTWLRWQLAVRFTASPPREPPAWTGVHAGHGVACRGASRRHCARAHWRFERSNQNAQMRPRRCAVNGNPRRLPQHLPVPGLACTPTASSTRRAARARRTTTAPGRRQGRRRRAARAAGTPTSGRCPSAPGPGRRRLAR